MKKTYLNQYKNNTIDSNLENWLLTDDEITFNENGKKILYNEFEYDEDIFQNIEKLKRVISNSIGKKCTSNNADWGGGCVWSIGSNNDYVGTFVYLGDDELVLLKRSLVIDEYDDETLLNINNVKTLYDLLTKLKSR